MSWAGLKIAAAGQPETSQVLSHWVMPEFEMRCGIIKKQLSETLALASPT
jgi:hypothetical protein